MNYEIIPCPFEKNEESKTLFPNPLRCLIVGSSGSGKTTFLWNLIINYWIPFKHLYFFTKSIDQPIYIKFSEIFNDLLEIETCIISEDIISIDECKPNSLVVFDDYILEKQTLIKEYFVRGRPKNISCIYLAQCYSLVDLKVIRNNLNFVVAFRQSDHYTEKMYKDFFSNIIDKEKFKSFCRSCWNEKYGFISFDITSKKIYNKLKKLYIL
jgi:GTPase SAR1 family protein